MRVFSLVSLKTRCVQMRHNDQLGPFFCLFRKGFSMFLLHTDPNKKWRQQNHQPSWKQFRILFCSTQVAWKKISWWSTHIFRHSRKRKSSKKWCTPFEYYDRSKVASQLADFHVCRPFFLFDHWKEMEHLLCGGKCLPKVHFTSPTLGHY